MKIGISVWSFPDDWELCKIFKTASEAGFDGVEVTLGEAGEISLNSTPDDMKKIRDLAGKYKIELYSVASGLYWNYSLTSVNTAEKAKSIFKKQLTIAKWLGCDTILAVPGSVGADFIPNCEIIEYDTAYERSLEAMNELKIYAEQAGIVVGLENVWNKFLLSPLEMRDFIDRINSEYVGVYFDVGNVLCNGYPEHWIKILGNRIRKVHLKDFKRNVGTIDGFTSLLTGDVNYPLVMAALNRIGYNGWVTAEVGIYRDYPEQGIYDTASAMKRIIG